MLTFFGLTALLFLQPPASDSPTAIVAETAQVTLIEQVLVAAREAGTVAEMGVREGELVTTGQEIARLDDRDAAVAAARAGIELEIAAEQATNDVDIRFAHKSHEVSQAELRRALESVERFSRSVSQTDLDRLRLAAERAELQIEQSDRDQKIAALTQRLKANEVEAARLALDRRRVASPLDGMVVEVFRRAGEWVDPGEAVVRVVRVDRLRVEAFLNAREVDRDLAGRAATLTVEFAAGRSETFQGEVVFVSPEIEPVTGQFRVWAEVDNRDNLLAPGLHGRLEILPEMAEAAEPPTEEASR